MTQSARGCWQAAQSWPGPSLQCSQLCKETGSCPVYLAGPCRASTPPAPEGTRLCSKQTSQTAELAGKLGAIIRHRCSSGHACIHLQNLRTRGFLLVLPLQEAAPGCRLAPPGLETSACSLLTLSPVTIQQPGWFWLRKAYGSDQ